MVRIPIPRQQTGVSTAPIAPQIGPDMFTSDIRAIGRAGGAVADVAVSVHNRLSSAEVMSVDADLSAVLTEINIRYTGPDSTWRNQQYGSIEGQKPLTDLTADWEKEMDDAITAANGQFKIASKATKDRASAQWKLNKIRQGARVNAQMVDMSKDAAELAVHKQFQKVLNTNEPLDVVLSDLEVTRFVAEKNGTFPDNLKNQKIYERAQAEAERNEKARQTAIKVAKKAARRGFIDGHAAEAEKVGLQAGDRTQGREDSEEYINGLDGLASGERTELKTRADDFWNIKDDEFKTEQEEYRVALNQRIADKTLHYHLLISSMTCIAKTQRFSWLAGKSNRLELPPSRRAR